jgi:hypothetical protein
MTGGKKCRITIARETKSKKAKLTRQPRARRSRVSGYKPNLIGCSAGAAVEVEFVVRIVGQSTSQVDLTLQTAVVRVLVEKIFLFKFIRFRGLKM